MKISRSLAYMQRQQVNARAMIVMAATKTAAEMELSPLRGVPFVNPDLSPRIAHALTDSASAPKRTSAASLSPRMMTSSIMMFYSVGVLRTRKLIIPLVWSQLEVSQEMDCWIKVLYSVATSFLLLHTLASI